MVLNLFVASAARAATDVGEFADLFALCSGDYELLEVVEHLAGALTGAAELAMWEAALDALPTDLVSSVLFRCPAELLASWLLSAEGFGDDLESAEWGSASTSRICEVLVALGVDGAWDFLDVAASLSDDPDVVVACWAGVAGDPAGVDLRRLGSLRSVETVVRALIQRVGGRWAAAAALICPRVVGRKFPACLVPLVTERAGGGLDDLVDRSLAVAPPAALAGRLRRFVMERASPPLSLLDFDLTRSVAEVARHMQSGRRFPDLWAELEWLDDQVLVDLVRALRLSAAAVAIPVEVEITRRMRPELRCRVLADSDSYEFLGMCAEIDEIRGDLFLAVNVPLRSVWWTRVVAVDDDLQAALYDWALDRTDGGLDELATLFPSWQGTLDELVRSVAAARSG